MAYKNAVSDWQIVTLSANDVATIRAVVERAFKAAGGRGELPKATSMRNVLKGEVSVDAAAFQIGNVKDDADVALAKAWAEAIADGRGHLPDIAAWPMLHKMVSTLLIQSAAPAPKAPPAPPAPKAPPAPLPAAKVGAAHGVTITRKGKRAA